MGKVSLDLGHEWAGLGDTVAEQKTAFSVRAGLWREGTKCQVSFTVAKAYSMLWGKD